MKTLKFGIEIETVGRTREQVAEAIRSVVGGTIKHVGTPYYYDPWEVTDDRGRVWMITADSSLSADKPYQAEVASPILGYDDIAELQEVVRAIRKAGAKTDHSTGLHIHIDGSRFDARAITNLVKMINKQEQLIEHALGINQRRLSRWCRSIDQDFIAKLEQRKPKTMNELNQLWYGHYNGNPIHYDNSRYHGVNLHSMFFRSTIEFRWFEATLHAGKVKAYIQFILALAAKALEAKSANSKKREFNAATAKQDLRIFMISALKLNGEEFKTCRKHMLALLDYVRRAAA